jgi:hypothetical protein
MKTTITKTVQVSTQAKPANEQVSLNKPYVLWSKTSKVDLLSLEVIDGFLRDHMMLHFSKQRKESETLIVEFERVRSSKLNNYFSGEILQELTDLKTLVVHILENKTLISETIIPINELN